ncbi:MAG: septal ring lytic transglycosylase RlpA family protein [Pseudomonadota bacterium]
MAILLTACNQFFTGPKADINNETKFSSKEYGVKGSPRVTVAKKTRKGGGRYQVGKPYKIRGKWYTPKEDPTYVASGTASWYGPNFHGRLTANGEIYDQYALSAAHPTMPLPSYARVTNVDNGRSVIVRVNDRGPFAKNRIIDLSSRAADLLEYKNQGVANVKVEYVGKARMDGLDQRYLMASFKNPSAKPGFWPGMGTANTLVAKANTKAPTQTGKTVEQQIEEFLLASNIPVPSPRPGRVEPGIAMNILVAEISGNRLAYLSAYHSGYRQDQSGSEIFNVVDLKTTGSIAQKPGQIATGETEIRVGSFYTLEEAEVAHEIASRIGPATIESAGQDSQETTSVSLHVGTDVAEIVHRLIVAQGYLSAEILR